MRELKTPIEMTLSGCSNAATSGQFSPFGGMPEGKGVRVSINQKKKGECLWNTPAKDLQRSPTVEKTKAESDSGKHNNEFTLTEVLVTKTQTIWHFDTK